MSDRGTLRETYHAAIQHDLVSLSGEEQLVGVVRRPAGWFLGTVDENHRALGPPDELLDEFKARHEDLKSRGMCDEGAHNAAWEELDFANQYREYLETDPDAETATEAVSEHLRRGEDVVLVCFEGENKRCHRHELKDVLEARV